jgi:hypothetical protein
LAGGTADGFVFGALATGAAGIALVAGDAVDAAAELGALDALAAALPLAGAALAAASPALSVDCSGAVRAGPLLRSMV